jgi:multicomponent Na+:H+ antiporter subunit E
MGVPIVAAATIGSLVASPPRRIALRLRPLTVLVGTFLYGSLRGGWDVSRRALSPTLPVSPVLVQYRTRLDSGAAQKVFTSLVTLMPGTLTADILGRNVCIHALVDRGDDLQRDLTTLEERVAHAFGIELEGAEAPHA